MESETESVRRPLHGSVGVAPTACSGGPGTQRVKSCPSGPGGNSGVRIQPQVSSYLLSGKTITCPFESPFHTADGPNRSPPHQAGPGLGARSI